MLRALDPRFNPSLPPEQWEAAARVGRLRVFSFLAILCSLIAGAAAYRWYPIDLTAGLSPEEVARAAGTALLKAESYRFSVELSGQAAQYSFPTASLTGAYERAGDIVELSGTVTSGDVSVPVAYYLHGKDYYMKHPTSGQWLVDRGASQSELEAFLPANLAAPMIGGVQSAREVGREQLSGGEAVRLQLTLDPNVMLPQMPVLQRDLVEHQLWVYTRTLKPARFAVQVIRQTPAQADKPPGDRFHYELVWEFDRPEPVAVPDEVRTGAQDVGAD